MDISGDTQKVRKSMKSVFEKIIEKLEENQTIVFNLGGGKPKQSIDLEKAIEIVKQEAEKYNNGHFGCNTNGEHEKCNGCGLTNCKSRNKIWFGVGDDDTDTNVGSNRWIPCSSGVMPRANGWYLVTNQIGVVQEQRWSANHWEKLRDDAVLAWRELPSPYQPKGE